MCWSSSVLTYSGPACWPLRPWEIAPISSCRSARNFPYRSCSASVCAMSSETVAKILVFPLSLGTFAAGLLGCTFDFVLMFVRSGLLSKLELTLTLRFGAVKRSAAGFRRLLAWEKVGDGGARLFWPNGADEISSTSEESSASVAACASFVPGASLILTGGIADDVGVIENREDGTGRGGIGAV